jgi:hypothetical protein
LGTNFRAPIFKQATQKSSPETYSQKQHLFQGTENAENSIITDSNGNSCGGLCTFVQKYPIYHNIAIIKKRYFGQKFPVGTGKKGNKKAQRRRWSI